MLLLRFLGCITHKLIITIFICDKNIHVLTKNVQLQNSWKQMLFFQPDKKNANKLNLNLRIYRNTKNTKHYFPAPLLALEDDLLALLPFNSCAV